MKAGEMIDFVIDKCHFCWKGHPRVQRDIWKFTCWRKTSKGWFRFPTSEVLNGSQGRDMA